MADPEVRELVIPKYTRRVSPFHSCYYKFNWEDPWIFVSGLYCDEATWSLSPSQSTAQLRCQYGYGMHANVYVAPAYDWIGRLTLNRAYIRILIEGQQVDEELDASHFEWVGIVEETNDTVSGVQRELVGDDEYDRQTGEQVFRAIGMDGLLDRSRILTSWWLAPGEEEEDDPVAAMVNVPLQFNAMDEAGKIVGNRSEATDPVSEVYLFTDKTSGTAHYWTTKKIADYIIKFHSPRKELSLEKVVPYELYDPNQYLPDWDHPIVSTEGQTAWGVLNGLMSRGRLLSWRCTYFDDAESDEPEPRIRVEPFSLAGQDTVIDDADIITANQRQVRIVYDGERSGQFNFHASTYQAVDQVIFQGARRTSTGSLAWNDSETPPIKEGWTDELQDGYDEAAKDRAGYSLLNKDQKQQANIIARAADKYLNVYRRFVIADDWNGKTTGTTTEGTGKPFFPSDEDDDEIYRFWPKGLVVLPGTRLRDGFDWEYLDEDGGASTPELTPGPHDLLPPMIFFRLPDSKDELPLYVQGDQVGRSAKIPAAKADKHKYTWGARVTCPQADRSFHININGDQQHLLVGERFQPPAETVDLPAGKWDWRKAIFTITLLDDRIAEARFPADQDLSDGRDTWRRLVINVGDKYRQDYMVPNTVVGIDPVSGELRRCVSGGYIADNRKELMALSKMAYEYYKRPRRALQWTSDYVTTAIQPGDYITEFGDLERLQVGTIVTEIRVSIPQQGTASIAYQSNFMELDQFREVVI